MSERYRRWTQALRVPLGFLLAVIFWVASRPTQTTLIGGGAVAGVGVALRFWAAGHIEKGRVLTTSGPYAWTRNPLYLGSLIIGLGFGIISGTLSIPLLVVGYFLLVYWPVMKQEEQELRNTFPEQFVSYARQVPRLLPTRKPQKVERLDPVGKFQLARALKNREYNATLGYIGMILLVYLKYLRILYR